MNLKLLPCVLGLALAGACAQTATPRTADPLTEFRFKEGGGLKYERNGELIVDVQIRNQRLIYNGRDLCAYPDDTPLRFLADGDLLVDGKRVSTKGEPHA